MSLVVNVEKSDLLKEEEVLEEEINGIEFDKSAPWPQWTLKKKVIIAMIIVAIFILYTYFLRVQLMKIKKLDQLTEVVKETQGMIQKIEEIDQKLAASLNDLYNPHQDY